MPRMMVKTFVRQSLFRWFVGRPLAQTDLGIPTYIGRARHVRAPTIYKRFA